jgi:predicted ester cyclase
MCLFVDGDGVKEVDFIGVGVNGKKIKFVIHTTTNI